MLHVGGTVEHHIYIPERLQAFRTRDVARHGADARAEEAAVVFLEVIDHHLLEATLRSELSLAAQQAPNGGVGAGALQQFLEHVDAQEAGGAGEEDILPQPQAFPAFEGSQAVVPEQAVDGRIVVVGDVAVFLFCGLVSLEEVGQGTGRRMGEDVGIGEVQALFLGVHHHVGHHKGCSAQVKERIRGTHAFHAQDIGEDGAEGLFRLSNRGYVIVHGRRGCRRQVLHIHLLVHVERNLVQLHPGSGHHVRRLALTDKAGGGLDIQLSVHHHICGQEFSAGGGVEGLYRDVLHAGHFLDDGFHFLEFDAETADFNLTVFSAHEFYVAVGAETHDITGAIQPYARQERIFNEALGRFLGVVEVSPAHAGAADEQFAGSTHGQTPHLAVHHIQLDVAQRMADGNVVFLLQHVEHRGENGAFRGTIAVVEGIGRRRHGDQLFTADRQVFQGWIVGEVTGIHHAHLGGHEAVCNAVIGDKAVQGAKVVPHLFGNNAHTCSAGEGGVLVHHIGVEAVAGKSRHAVSGLEVIIVLVPGAEIHQVLLLQHTAFWLAG